ncbi:response regulator [Vulgatibacter incomptus]|uniref:Response regulator n=1 Tax=Vulgatibacter incomptus TaxID=1391653 RepID=A0A0K1P9Z4_9BACT|nr:response regulator [Vulgatibacter incomptus]AKU90358.1 response regulator [Vulgatibacter incomptus]
MAEKTVLVVDDERDIREAIVEILLGDDIAAFGAASGEEAVRIASEQPIGLLILDLMMPEMDGRQVVEELRRRKLDVPVVLISAGRDLKRVASELGLPAVEKPFDLDHLLSTVREYV